MSHCYFDIGGNGVELITDDRAIFERISRRFNCFITLERRQGIRLCLFRVDKNPSAIIPGDAVHIRTGPDSEHYLYGKSWLIDFPGLAVMVIDREREQALGFVQPDCLEKTPWLLEAMVHPVFELLRQRGLYLAHSAAVSLGDKGALIIGKAGGGKTTLALRLAGKDFKFLSDDRCFLRGNGPRFEMLSFPEEVRVHPGNVADLQEFQFLLSDSDNNGCKKSFPIREVYPDSVIDHARVDVIVFPQWCPDKDSRVDVISAREAMVEMLPQTLEFFFPNTSRVLFGFIGDLVIKVPSFRLYLGSNRERWHQLVADLIA